MRAINLVPADSRPGRVNGGKSGGAAYGVIGALVVLVLGLSVMAMSKRDAARAEQELATIQQSTQAYTSVASEFSSFEQAASQATQRIATVRGLAEARFDWAGTLRDMSRLIPADTQIFGLTASVATDSGSGGGGASSQFRAAIEAPAVALSGCSKSQTTVANLVNQLQAMRRVTNVTLETSARAGASSGSASDCTVGGDPYEFALVVFFAPGKAKAAGEVVAATTPSPSTIATESSSATPTTPGATTPEANPTGGSQ